MDRYGNEQAQEQNQAFGLADPMNMHAHKKTLEIQDHADGQNVNREYMLSFIFVFVLCLAFAFRRTLPCTNSNVSQIRITRPQPLATFEDIVNVPCPSYGRPCSNHMNAVSHCFYCCVLQNTSSIGLVANSRPSKSLVHISGTRTQPHLFPSPGTFYTIAAWILSQISRLILHSMPFQSFLHPLKTMALLVLDPLKMERTSS